MSRSWLLERHRGLKSTLRERGSRVPSARDPTLWGNPWTFFTPGNRDSNTLSHPVWKQGSLLPGNQRKQPTPRCGSTSMLWFPSPNPPNSLLGLWAPLNLQTWPTPAPCTASPFTCKCWSRPPAPPVPPGKSYLPSAPVAWAPVPSLPHLQNTINSRENPPKSPLLTSGGVTPSPAAVVHPAFCSRIFIVLHSFSSVSP